TYICTVTDSAGCTATTTMTITEPAVLTVTPSANTSVCNGQTASISATAAGGTQPYNYSWNPGPLAGANQNVSPSATTTYTITVTDANSCTATGTTTVTINPVPVAAFSSDVQSGCSPLIVQFSDLSTVASPGTITSWSWDFGDGTGSTQSPSHTYNTAGVYTVILTVTTSDGCTHTLTMPNYINVAPDPVAEFVATPQPTTILEPNICFLDQSIGASTWSWSFGDIANSASSLMNPCFVYQDTGCYDVLLAVASPNGCVDTVVHPICIAPDFTMFIPNTFTPDGNGSNDVFIPVSYGVDLSTFEMWIFDRWGNMIYYTDNLSKGWDGKVQGHDGIAQIDTYVYKIRCKDYFQVKHLYIGHVNLVK
ncbi:MAG: PKD domain-containing protein, partial [Bacteroidetes bacterium]